MHFLVAAHGLDTVQAAAVREALADRAGTLHEPLTGTGEALIAVSDPAPGLVRVDTEAAQPRVELGSVWVSLGPAGLRAGVGSGPNRLFAAETEGGGTLLSTNLDVLRRLPVVHTAPDRSYEDFLLGFGFLPDTRTVHRGLRVLQPGTHELGAGPARPASAPAPDPDDGHRSDQAAPTFEVAADRLHDLFMEAMDELAGPATDHAVLLGGFDSALVAATLARLGKRVTTYTFGFGDPRHEQRNVGLLTAAIGSTERWVHIAPSDTMDALREFGAVFSQPSPQPHYQLHTLLACRAVARDGFDHVLTGDGCDALFLGYPTVHTRARLLDALRAAPAPLVRAGLSVMSTRLADRHLGHVARMARSTLGNLLLPMPERGHLPTRYLDEVALGRLRRGPAPVQTESIEEIRHRLAAPLAGLDPVRLAFHGNALTGQSRVKVDGAVNATGVRQASPYQHPKLQRFVDSLPQQYLRPGDASAGSAGKAVLLEMVRRHRLLPEAIIDMPKQSPAEAPVDEWYAGPLRAEIASLLRHLPFEWDRRFLDALLRDKAAERVYRQRVALSHHAFQAVGLLASYASFHRP